MCGVCFIRKRREICLSNGIREIVLYGLNFDILERFMRDDCDVFLESI